ncbi:MAG: thiol peroxidase [Mariniblastus sp.]|nr:thiol peroxidase [Mariniblastus sp.]
MAAITLKGNPINTCGDLPAVGSVGPEFSLTGADLSEVTLDSFRGKNVILSIVPSFDTPVCANSVRKFNESVGGSENSVVVNVSMDLPFAQKRFCESEGLEHVINLSAFRSPDFGSAYGMTIVDGPLAGLFGRAIVVLNSEGAVTHVELVPEIAQEPDYDAALAAVSETN